MSSITPTAFAMVSPPRKKVIRAEGRAVRVAGRKGVLRGAPVVQGDAAQRGGLLEFLKGVLLRVGVEKARRRVGAAFVEQGQRQDNLAEAVVVEVFGNNECLREDDAHPFKGARAPPRDASGRGDLGAGVGSSAVPTTLTSVTSASWV